MPTKKQLQEENKKLKARLADGDKVSEWIDVIATHVMHAQELVGEIDELKEENEILKDFMPDGYEFYLQQGISMNYIIDKITDENKKLKEEIKQLKK